jgi:hypothetical protein
MHLAAEAVECAALALQGIDNVHGCDRLSLGMLGIGDCVSDNVLQEDFQDTTGLLVDKTAETLDTTASSETTNGWLRDALDVVAQDFSVSLGATFSQSFASFSAS